MKLNYSNKELLSRLSRSYAIKKADNKKLIIFSIIGAAAGAIVTAYFLTYYQRKRMKEMASNLKRQANINNQLIIHNQTTQQELNNALMKQSEFTDAAKDTTATDVTT
jgi:predicted small secreted protein